MTKLQDPKLTLMLVVGLLGGIAACTPETGDQAVDDSLIVDPASSDLPNPTSMVITEWGTTSRWSDLGFNRRGRHRSIRRAHMGLRPMWCEHALWWVRGKSCRSDLKVPPRDRRGSDKLRCGLICSAPWHPR